MEDWERTSVREDDTAPVNAMDTTAAEEAGTERLKLHSDLRAGAVGGNGMWYP